MDAKPLEDAGPAPLLRFDQDGALARRVMDHAAVGMALFDLDRRLLYVNAAFARMIGDAPDDLLGRDAASLIHADDVSATLQQLTRLLGGEAEQHVAECCLRRHDGSAIWALGSASLLRGERAGRPLQLIWQVIDIDRRKQAEAALAYSESRWNYALEATGQGVWDHDIRSDDMFYSARWRTMRGFAPDEAVNPAQKEWLKRVHPDDVPRILQMANRQDAGEEGFDTLEYRERHRDGHWVWILSRGKPVEWAPDGTPIRTVGTDTDITRQKQIEAQLAAEKERLRVTLHSIGDGVISTDAAGSITFLNPVAETMTGWTSAEAIGLPLASVFAIVDESTDRPATSPVASCLARGEVSYLEEDVVLLGRDGVRRDIRSSAAPLRTASGDTLGAVLVFQDITSSRTLQKQLAHSATHDALTGLPNRIAFERAMVTVNEQSGQERREHALAFIDLDRFKAVNDSAGHAAGDALLQLVADMIRRSCRRRDFAARIGGDEFAVLLSDCAPAAAQRVAQKVVDAVAAIRFEWEGTSYTIGASIGITRIGDGSAPPAELMREADAACYRAKAGGRGRVVIHGANNEGSLDRD